MSKIRRVLQLLHEAGLSQREAARAAGVGKTCVSDIASRARAAGLSWAQARELDDDALQARLHPAPVARSARHLEPDWSELHQQLKRPGVTLQLLWEEYQLAHDGRAYKYSAFCEKYARFARGLKRSMRQVHKAGERLFVDYAGQTVELVDMLAQNTLDQLRGLRLDGLVAALQDPATTHAAADLDFHARLALLVQREVDWRDDKRLCRLLKAAQLKVSGACMQDIDWRASRGLNRALMAELATAQWVRDGRSVLLTGATGCGKTWLACALARQAARAGHAVLYTRTARLLQELHVAHGDGSFKRRLGQLARVQVLVLDDFALTPIAAHERGDLLELLDDRVGSRATIITSQLPPAAWHAWLGEPTLADAILDRVVHGAHKIALKGESMRRSRANASATTEAAMAEDTSQGG